MVGKQFAIGLLLGLSLAACAGAGFPYKYYGLDLVDQKLRGPEPKDDLNLAVCNGVEANAGTCITMFTDSFLSLKQDYLDTKNQLIACQHQLADK